MKDPQSQLLSRHPLGTQRFLMVTQVAIIVLNVHLINNLT